MYVCMCCAQTHVSMWTYFCYSVHVQVRGQFIGVCSLLTVKVPGIELKSSELATSTFIYFVIY